MPLLSSDSAPPKEQTCLWKTLLAGEEWPFSGPEKKPSGAPGRFLTEAEETANWKAEPYEGSSHLFLQAVAEASFRFLQTGSISDMAGILVESCTMISGASFGFLIDFGVDGQTRLLAATGMTPEGSASPGWRCVSAAVPADKSPASALAPEADLPYTPRCRVSDPLDAQPVESFLGIPLRAGGETLGVIGLGNRPGGFSRREAEAVEALGRTAALAIQSDRRERAHRQALEQISRVQKMETVGVLAGGMAHDLNNLLTAVNGYCELLNRDLEDDPLLRNTVEAIQKSGRYAGELTRRLMSLMRCQKPESRFLNINERIRGMAGVLGSLLGKKIEIVLELAPDIGSIKADPGQLEQLLMNLVVNAGDAMADGGRVTIETANVQREDNFPLRHRGVTPGPYVMLTVSDTGTGIPAEIRRRIFEPLFTTKQDRRGTGLGLAVVDGIVEQSRGWIQVASETGKGSTFKVFLPRVEEPHGAVAGVVREGSINREDTGRATAAE